MIGFGLMHGMRGVHVIRLRGFILRPKMLEIERRVQQLTRINISHAEDTQVLRYTENGTCIDFECDCLNRRSKK